MRLYLQFFFILLFSVKCFSQHLTEPHALNEVLSYYEKELDISFSYDPISTSMIFVDFNFKDKKLEESLEKIYSQSGLFAEKADQGYYILAFKEKEFTVFLTDDNDAKPLSGSYVTVFVNNKILGASTTNAQSELTFDYKPKVGDTLSFYALGYDYIYLSVSELVNDRKLILSLSPTTIYLDDIVIRDYLTNGISLNPINQSIKIAVNDLPSIPGETDGDIFASLALLPGVGTPDNRPGNLFIRGSSTDQSLILFDNIPIYHKGHYFGTISPYNPKIVESVNVFRSGLHARHGGRVGGAVEINSASDIQNDKKIGIGLNSLYGIGYVKTTLFKDKVGLAIGGRRSFPVSLNSPKLDAISDMVYAATGVSARPTDDFKVVYEDYNLKLELPVKGNSKLSLSGIYANNFTGYNVLTDSTSSRQKNGFENYGLNASLQKLFNKSIRSTSSFTVSDYNTFFKDGLGSGRSSFTNLIDMNFNQELTFGRKEAISFTAGLIGSYQLTNYRFKGNQTTRNQPNIPINLNQSTKAFTASPYFSTIINEIDRLSIEIGLRGTYYSLLNDLAIMPRLNLSYDLSESLILKGTYGNYRQYLSQIKYLEFGGFGFDNELWQLANDDVKIIEGNQVMFGAVFSKGRFVVDIEGYKKEANGVTYSFDKRPENGIVYDYASHLTSGVDILVKSRVGNAVDIWSGYSFSELFVQFDSLKNRKYRSKFDQPHVFFMGGNFSKGNWNISANWRISSGQYAFSPEIVAAERQFLIAGSQRPQPRPGRPAPPEVLNPFEDYPTRFKSVHFLDISASYKLPKNEKRRYLTTFGLSLLNVYDQRNLTDQVTRASTVNSVAFLERNAMKFAPNLMVIVEW